MTEWKWADIPESEKWKVYWGVMWRGAAVMVGFWLILFIVSVVIIEIVGR